MRPLGGYVRVGLERKLRLLALGVDHEPGVGDCLGLIWSLSLNRDPVGGLSSLDVQGATQATDGDQRDVAVHHCRSLSAAVDEAKRSRWCPGGDLPFGLPVNGLSTSSSVVVTKSAHLIPN